MKEKLFLLCTIAGVFSSPIFAATFNISNGNVLGLIAAINTANSNSEADIINLAPNGNYTLTSINYTSINPNNANNSGFEGSRALPLILKTVAGINLTINGNGATIQRSSSASNFGLFACSGQTIFNNIIFRNGNTNFQGAAIFVLFKGNIEVNSCKFFDNTSLIDAEGGGGAIYTKSLSVLKVVNSYFENNKAMNQGGAISNLLSDMTITGSEFKNNSTTNQSAGPAGGAIYSDGARGDNGKLVMINNNFEGNSCTKGQGGAMFLFPYRNQMVEVTGSTFKSNTAEMGVAFWHQGGGSGGIFDTEYPLSSGPENTTFNFHDCIFDSNKSISQGGGMWLSQCKMNEIYNLTFKNNESGLGGGLALLSDRKVTLRNSTFNNNKANAAGALFPGIQAGLDIINCTFTSNIASQWGGALTVPQNSPATPVNIINCTFADNQGNNPGNGQSAAIHSGNNQPNPTVTLTNNIFSNNTVTNNYGLWRDCNAILNDGGKNIFFPAGVGQNCVSTPNFVNSLLSPLAMNGGVTETMALTSGSPAIDNGKSGDCPQFDQRGAARVGICDIGAYEFSGSVLSALKIDSPGKLVLYPNPTSTGKITVEIPTDFKGENNELTLLDSSGKKIRNNALNFNEKIFILDLSIYPKGIYYLLLHNQKTSLRSKIMIN